MGDNMVVRQEPIAAAPPKQRSAGIPLIEVALAAASAYDAAGTSPFVSAGPLESLPLPVSGMKPQRFDAQFSAILDLAAELCAKTDAGSLLLMLEGPTDWDRLREHAGDLQIVIAADTAEELAGADQAGLATIILNMAEA